MSLTKNIISEMRELLPRIVAAKMVSFAGTGLIPLK
jgi:hypothetical protein